MFSFGWFYPVNRIEVRAEAIVNPTEDPAKVERAIRAIVREGSLEKIKTEKGSLLKITAHGLDSLIPLQALLRQDRIRDAARSVLFSGVAGKTVRFSLNKQVAYVSHISFSEPNEEPPLGTIDMEISCDDPESLINWIAPRSR